MRAFLVRVLYKALSGDRSPSFDTILKVISALGLKLKANASQSRASRSSGPYCKTLEECDRETIAQTFNY